MKVDFKGVLNKVAFNLKWRCNACDEENFNGDYFCDDCLAKLPFIKENKCEHCGRFALYSVSVCDSCSDKNIFFDKARSLFSYESPISFLIQNLKYNEQLYLADIFADYFVEVFLSNFADADFITFVPSTQKSLKQRGYNQAKVIADRLSKLINLPVYSTVVKVKETFNQATLNFDERTKNLLGVFKADRIDLKDKTVLLIDDVLTTGTTANLIAKILKKNKAKKVYVLTVASVSKIKYKRVDIS